MRNHGGCFVSFRMEGNLQVLGPSEDMGGRCLYLRKAFLLWYGCDWGLNATSTSIFKLVLILSGSCWYCGTHEMFFSSFVVKERL